MPLAVLSAMREASIYHITVKGGKFLEAVAQADTIVFDKTGTLTHACPVVARVIPFGGRSEDDMLRVAACLEEHFPHSMANAIVRAARERNLPIRIGVNAGSLPKDLLEKYGHPTAEALVEAAWRHIHILEDMDYRNIKVSLKAHDVPLTLAAYRLLASQCDYPLHVGITEAGTVNSGIIKSAVGIGTLLAEGIGDTIRVSLTGDPVNEVKVAYDILKALGLREHGPTLISCPTCGRTRINLEKLALEVERRLEAITEPITVAVMGCVVNGPGEAREADVGLAGGIGEGLIFRKGEVLRKVPEEKLVNELFVEIEKILLERKVSH